MQIVTYNERNFVKRHRGTLPVLLTAPHGGSVVPPGVLEREETQTPRGCDFVIRRDNQTLQITEAVAQRLLDLTGLSPYTVIACFRRRYADANRSAAIDYLTPAQRRNAIRQAQGMATYWAQLAQEATE